MKKILILILTFITFLIISQEDEYYFATGNIANISCDSITIAEYNIDTNSSKNITYKIDKKVKLIGFKTLKSLKINDYIEFEYIIKDNIKIIQTIMLE